MEILLYAIMLFCSNTVNLLKFEQNLLSLILLVTSQLKNIVF